MERTKHMSLPDMCVRSTTLHNTLQVYTRVRTRTQTEETRTCYALAKYWHVWFKSETVWFKSETVWIQFGFKYKPKKYVYRGSHICIYNELKNLQN